MDRNRLAEEYLGILQGYLSYHSLDVSDLGVFSTRSFWTVGVLGKGSKRDVERVCFGLAYSPCESDTEFVKEELRKGREMVGKRKGFEVLPLGYFSGILFDVQKQKDVSSVRDTFFYELIRDDVCLFLTLQVR